LRFRPLLDCSTGRTTSSVWAAGREAKRVLTTLDCHSGPDHK